MTSNSHIVPTVPISYVLLILDIVADYGIDKNRLLDGLNIPKELLNRPDGRISLLGEYADLCQRALDLTGEPGLAYEFGLRSTLTTHGILGYGLMSQASVRDVLRFADRFGSVLRMPAWHFHFSIEPTHAVLEGREAVSHGSLRRFSCETLLSSVSSVFLNLLPEAEGVELLFDYPEPEYHARYRERLPECHFSTSVTQMRIPIRYLDTPLRTADAVSAQLAERECERELNLLGHNRDIVNQVRAMLINGPEGYPDMESVAARLYVSSRTLSRQLCERGNSFRQLLEESQKRDSLAMLRDPRLNLNDVAIRLGYSSMANFARAFREWYGDSPGKYRSMNKH